MKIKPLFRWITIFVVLALFLLPLQQAFATDTAKTSTLQIGWPEEPDSLSVFGAYKPAAAEVFLLTYDSLISFDNNLKPVPDLATSWSVSSDNLTWTFHLAKRVKWHDGQPFTSKDVKFTYETLQKSGLGMYASFLQGITSVDTPDDYTVVIKTDKPKANMLQITTPILPKHIWENVPFNNLDKWQDDRVIGTGPFKVVEWKKGQYLKLEANKNYFKGRPYVDQVVYQLYTNDGTIAQALKTGDIDAAIEINPVQIGLLSKVKGVKVIAAPNSGFSELAINSWTDPKSKGNPLLLNKDIRHAMEYAIDRQKIIDVAYSGQGTPGSTLITSNFTTWHYTPDDLRTYNPDKAKAILDAAGFKDTNGDGIRETPDGKKLEFRFFLRSASLEQTKSGELIAGMLKDVGIATDVEVVDDGVLNDRIYTNADYDLFIWRWGLDVDPTTILSVMTTNQVGNLSDSYYSNAQYDKLVDDQATLLDPKARQQEVRDAQKMVYEDSPYIILVEEAASQAVRTDKWTGWQSVAGSYLMTFNNYNYTHVKPTGVESAGKNSTLIWIVVAVAGVAIFFVVSSRKEKTDDDAE